MEKNTLEQYLRDLRSSCGYSQKYVAAHLNITRQTYSHYETGRITPPINSLYNLSKLYGIPIDNFLDLVVTYNINKDYDQSKQTCNTESVNDLSFFLDFISSPKYEKKFKSLDKRERRLLFYFLMLDERDRDDILTFMKIKYQRQIDERKK